MPQFKNKRTGVIWEIDGKSPTFKRVMAEPDAYEEVKEAPKRRNDKSM